MPTLFDDRKQAGEQLADKIEEYFDEIRAGNFKQQRNDKLNKQLLLVLAIPRGGVILGDIIASRFHCNLDMVISKKIGAPIIES